MKYQFCVFFLLLYTSFLFTQNIVKKIDIEGLHPKTAKFSRRFISTQVNDTLDLSKLDQDVQCLLNQRLFSDVKYRLDTIDQGVGVVFVCEKILTFLPIINLGHVKGNAFYQLGFRDLNFMKRKGVFKAYDIIMNKKHSFYLFAEMPYVFHSNLGLATSLKWAQTIEPILFKNHETVYTLSNDYYSAGLFYEFSQNHRVYLYNAWYNQAFFKQEEGVLEDLLPSVRKDKGYQLDLQYKNHKVNYKSLYLDGWGVDAELKMTWGELIPYFMQGIVTGAYYKRIKLKGDFATRLKFGLTSNELGAFGPFSLDSYLNLRGAGTKVDRGTGQMVLNLEYRHSLIENKNVCVQGVVFSDLGTWRKDEDPTTVLFTADRLRTFSGIGTRVFVTKVYDLVFRLDYGVSLMNNQVSGLVFGLGQYF